MPYSATLVLFFEAGAFCTKIQTSSMRVLWDLRKAFPFRERSK